MPSHFLTPPHTHKPHTLGNLRVALVVKVRDEDVERMREHKRDTTFSTVLDFPHTHTLNS